MQQPSKLQLNHSNYNILAQAIDIIHKFPQLASFEHLKGHQDNTSDIANINRPAQMNILADHAATNALTVMKQTNPLPTIPTSACTAYLLHQGKIISSKENSIARTAWNRQRIDTYYKDRWKISDQAYESINWEVTRAVRKRMTEPLQTFWTKLACGWLPTGHQLAKYGRQQPCPRCQITDETFEHILQCPKNQGDRATYNQELKTTLARIGTSPALARTISNWVANWMDGEVIMEPANTLSWELWVKGIQSKHWVNKQAKYISSLS